MKKFLLSIGFFLCVHLALAWNARGHMIVAAITWDNLDPASQKKVTDILVSHPDYRKIWKKEYKKYKNDLVLGKFLMMQASTWPDDIRNFNHPLHKLNKGEWHYISYSAVFPDSHDSSIPLDDSFKGNIVYAIAHARDIVVDIFTPDDQKAVYLSWLIHLMGDIHQPLHCVSLFNDQFPKGDSGGNKFYIRPNTAGIKLHTFWDGLLGGSDNFRTASNQGVQITNKYSREKFYTSDEAFALDENENPREWSLSSFQDAIKHVYLDGNLKYGLTKEEAAEIPKDYGKKSKALAEIKVATAGYRLTNIIARAF